MATSSTGSKTSKIPFFLTARQYPNGIGSAVFYADKFPSPKKPDTTEGEFLAMREIFESHIFFDMLMRNMAYFDRPMQCREMPKNQDNCHGLLHRMRSSQRKELEKLLTEAFQEFHHYVKQNIPATSTQTKVTLGREFHMYSNYNP